EDYLRKNLPDLLEAYSELPSWLPEILVKCLSWEVDERFRDAGELLKELNVKLSYSEKVPFRKKQIISDAAYGRDGKKAGIIEVMQEFDLLPYARPTVVAAIALIGILLFIIAYSRYNPPPPPTASAVAAVQAVGLPQDQKELTKNILEPIKKRSWNDIKQMMNEAPEHKPAAGRLHFAEKGTWERPSKPQQEPSHRASAQHFPGPYVQTPAYSPLSEAPDEQEMPLIAQRNRASETAPQSLPFSSAAHNGQIERPAHNESNTVHIRPVTRLPSYRTPVAAHRHRESNTLETPNDIDAALIAVPDGDTARLQRAAEKAISQELYAPLQQTLLEVLVRSPEATPPEVLYALAQSGAGLINYGHIQQLSGWRSPLAQYALLAACANARDSKTLDAAFIALASRGLRGYWPNLMVG
ncbi:MAG TPA: hypothetical protein PLP17_15350, partial [Oligoflexia bacterium]|nr:hypothetical protein [Oligoflexia bacterium]